MAAIESRRTPMVSLLSANTISLVGSMLTIVALPWFVLQTTGSPSKAGLVGVAATIPRLLAGVFGGTLVDSVGPKRMSSVADLMSGLGIALIPLLHHTIGLAFWQLLTLVFIGNLLNNPGVTSRRAILPELAELAQIKLERVNSAFESINNVSRLVGAPLAGILVALLGASNVLWIDALTFVISAVTVAVGVPDPPVAAKSERRQHYWCQLAVGFQFLRGDRVLLWMAIALMFNNPFVVAFTPVILPVYVKQAFGSATEVGLLIASIGAGAVLGAVLYGTIGPRLPRRPTWLFVYLIGPLEYWALLLHPPLPVLVGLLFMVGIATGPINPLMVTVRHERIPLALRGRVFSLFSAMAVAVQPLGIAAAGYAIAAFGLNTTVFAFAAITQGVGIVLILVPALKALDEPLRSRT